MSSDNQKVTSSDKQNNSELVNQGTKNDAKRNRVSFKQFQQNYQGHLLVQKQKKRTQQEGIKKAVLNTKNINENKSKDDKNMPSREKQTLCRNNSKVSIQKNTLTQINSINSSKFPSCFVSPKNSTSTHMFIKSINIASTKSKQTNFNIPQEKVVQSGVKKKEKAAEMKNNYTTINLNCGMNKSKSNQKLVIQANKWTTQAQNNMKKNPYFNSSEGTGYQIENKQAFKAINKTKYQGQTSDLNLPKFDAESITVLASSLQNLNESFEQLNDQTNQDCHSSEPSTKYRLKIQSLNTIKNILLDEQIVLFKNNIESSIKALYINIVSLIQNYKNDLKYMHSRQNNKRKKLEIKVDVSDHQYNLQNQVKKQKSKKKTIKLSKSRRTNEETNPSDSIINPFQPSDFSLINTSKITQISRPSSHNKQRSKYMNEIQNVISNKMIENSFYGDNKNQTSIRHLNKSHQKSIQGKGFLLQNNTKHNILICQPKNKSVTKTISLIGNNKNKSSIDKQTQKVQKQNQVRKVNQIEKILKEKLQTHKTNKTREKYFNSDVNKNKNDLKAKIKEQSKQLVEKTNIIKNKEVKNDFKQIVYKFEDIKKGNEQKQLQQQHQKFNPQNSKSQFISLSPYSSINFHNNHPLPSPPSTYHLNQSIYQLQYLQNYSSQHYISSAFDTNNIPSYKLKDDWRHSVELKNEQNCYESRLFK